MIAEKNPEMEQSVSSIWQLTEDEKIREQMRRKRANEHYHQMLMDKLQRLTEKNEALASEKAALTFEKEELASEKEALTSENAALRAQLAKYEAQELKK